MMDGTNVEFAEVPYTENTKYLKRHIVYLQDVQIIGKNI